MLYLLGARRISFAAVLLSPAIFEVVAGTHCTLPIPACASGSACLSTAPTAPTWYVPLGSAKKRPRASTAQMVKFVKGPERPLRASAADGGDNDKDDGAVIDGACNSTVCAPYSAFTSYTPSSSWHSVPLTVHRTAEPFFWPMLCSFVL
ncbi:hypothetical protein, unknown function [Leishmania tarentolae]|uniref:Secreted protein n=1 Tax=Leishmania tarentolae TaxID=5689 RepID=A0A640KK76_LEITA|nr:hypothetical protein, unknown function [Leishmania tarentolae]